MARWVTWDVKVWFHAFSVKCNQAEGSLIPGDPGVPGDQRGSQCTPNSPCPHKKNCLLIDISSDLPTPNILFSRSSQHFLSNFSLLPIVYLPPQWGDLLILFNRNNCSLSVGVFSSSLICESIAVQFPGAVSNLCYARGENSCGERFSFLEDNELVVFL